MNRPAPSLARRTQRDIPFAEEDFRRIATFAKSEYGLHLEPSKKAMIHSRLGRRIIALQLEGFAAYDAYLRENIDTESDHFVSVLTTNVTHFYRETHHFEQLQDEVLPPLVARARTGGRVRMWSAGCSSGQEPYSMAGSVIRLCPEAPKLDIRILATDIDPFVIRKAEEATYPEDLCKFPPGEWEAQVFAGSERRRPNRRVRDDVKALVAFRQLNINGKWPMAGRFDVIMCRNMAIYFDTKTQQTLWQRLAEKLNADGILFIGHSERVTGPATSIIEPAGVTAYRKRPGRSTAPAGSA